MTDDRGEVPAYLLDWIVAMDQVDREVKEKKEAEKLRRMGG